MNENDKNDNKTSEIKLGDNEDYIFSGYDVKPHSER